MSNEPVQKKIDDCRLSLSSELDLSDMGLVEVPPPVFDLLHLKSLRLTRNRLTRVPSEIGKLVDLEFLGLNYNELEYLPVEIGSLRNLRSLDLWNNKLKALPLELSKLTKLESLHLGFNRLNSIPRELYLPFSKLKGLDTQSNPFDDLPILRNLELIDLMAYFRAEDAYFGFIEVPKALQSAFQQYLNFFSEFVEKATGLEIPFDVKRTANGLKIRTHEQADLSIDKIGHLLKQYVDYLKKDSAEVKGSVELELFALRLEEQKKHFESQVRILEFENKYLKDNVDKLLSAHLDLSRQAMQHVGNRITEDELISKIRMELNKFSEENRETLLKEIVELETMLADKRVDKGTIKSKFQSLREVLIGASGGTISGGVVELFKYFI